MFLEDTPTEALSPQEEEMLHALLTDLPTAEPPADLTARIMNAVAAEEARSAITAVPKKKPAFRWRSLASLAAVFALALVGTWSLQHGQTAAPSATPTAQGETEIASYSMDEFRRSVSEEDSTEYGINTTGVTEEQATLDNNQQPVVNLPELSEALTPQTALERLVQGWHWLELGGTACAFTADYSDTEEISCRIYLTDGEEHTISKGIITYTHSDDNGYHFEWSENGTLSRLFTVTPDGSILTTTVTAPMNPSAPQD